MFRSVAGWAGMCVLAGVLALGGCDRGAGDAAQESAANTADSSPPPQLPGQVVRAFAGTQLPPLSFADPDGAQIDLATLDQPVLVNLWATWCAPCVVEMPALDNLAQQMEGRLKVLTISQDARGAEVVAPFFAARNFTHLEQWLDPQNDLAVALSDVGGLPLTVLFDAEGREILRVAGGYEWDSEEAIALMVEELAELEDASSAS